MSMTPDELVTRNDLAKMHESILKAMEAHLVMTSYELRRAC